MISENALMSGRSDGSARRDNGVNMAQFADWNRPFVDVDGNLTEESMREISVKPLDPFIAAHRQEQGPRG